MWAALPPVPPSAHRTFPRPNLLPLRTLLLQGIDALVCTRVTIKPAEEELEGGGMATVNQVRRRRCMSAL